MNYSLPSLTLQQVTNLYLYGQPNTPSNLIDESLIRSPEVAPNATAMTVVTLDAVTFLASGPGRYASATMSSLVNDFMQGNIMAATGARQELKTSDFVFLLNP